MRKVRSLSVFTFYYRFYLVGLSGIKGDDYNMALLMAR
jgi:hypothetical protein